MIDLKAKKEKKRLYDIEYRKKNREILKLKKAAYYQRTRDPEKEKLLREKNKQRHLEYCRTPEYRKWKKQYDQKYRDKKVFGEFHESQRLLIELEKELDKQSAKYDRRYLSGRLNKKMNRRRYYEKAKRKNIERIPLVYASSITG